MYTTGDDKIVDWRESTATSEAKAIAHAWIEFKRRSAGVVISVNGKPVHRISIKYREDGPYLAVERTAIGETGETWGACKAAGEMAHRYAGILEAHNVLGERLLSARRFVNVGPEDAE